MNNVLGILCLTHRVEEGSGLFLNFGTKRRSIIELTVLGLGFSDMTVHIELGKLEILLASRPLHRIR